MLYVNDLLFVYAIRTNFYRFRIFSFNQSGAVQETKCRFKLDDVLIFFFNLRFFKYLSPLFTCVCDFNVSLCHVLR